ncbi:hypothetical protein V2K56_26415 [Pseudomonas alliivorans]|nr:hypothetical protein [Pseudomonas alliivorans]
MNRPKPNTTAIEESAHASPADFWGEKEVAREIALLEAHVHEDRISRLIDESHVAVEANNPAGLKGLRYEILPVNIEDELKQSYLDYAMSVIVGRALPGGKAVNNLRELSRRGISLFTSFAHRLSAAIAINRLQKAALTFMSLSKTAEIACNRIPLFAYGPELSEFRHRLR